jgi:undecaprenyl diphosphate synthase
MQHALADVHLAVLMDGVEAWRRRESSEPAVAYRRACDAVDATRAAAVRAGVTRLTLIVPATAPDPGPRDAPDWPLQVYWPTISARASDHPIAFRVVGDSAYEPVQLGQGAPVLDVAFATGHDGRQDILTAVRQLARAAQRGEIDGSAIEADAIDRHIVSLSVGAPDAVLLTGDRPTAARGALVWQGAYSELLLRDRLWPDVTSDDIEAAIAEYQTRDRRYGAVRG